MRKNTFFDKSQIKFLRFGVKLAFFKVFTTLKNPNVCRRPSALTYPIPKPQSLLHTFRSQLKTNKQKLNTGFSVIKNKQALTYFLNKPENNVRNKQVKKKNGKSTINYAFGFGGRSHLGGAPYETFFFSEFYLERQQKGTTSTF